MKAFLLSFIFVGTNAFAASVDSVTVDQPVCFGREYSQAHMDKNPLQTVKKMSVKITKPDANDNYLLMYIDANVRTTIIEKIEDGTTYTYDKVKPYSNGMVCNGISANSMDCYIECDGGRAGVTWNVATKDNEITFINNGFLLYGGCGEDVEDESNYIWLDNQKGGDDVFKLYALPATSCQN